jgi:hypothetical protein
MTATTLLRALSVVAGAALDVVVDTLVGAVVVQKIQRLWIHRHYATFRRRYRAKLSAAPMTMKVTAKSAPSHHH